MKTTKWAELLEKSYSKQPLTCPECGNSDSVEVKAFADSDRQGFAILRCIECGAKQEFSRVKFPENAITEQL